MTHTIRSIALVSCIALAGCESTSAPSIQRRPRMTINPGSVTAIDVSGGVTTGAGVGTISRAGVMLGKTGSSRVSWNSPASSPVVVDAGYVNGGNRNADAAGGVGDVLLSTNGSAPWTSVNLIIPQGANAGGTVTRDVNDARVIVGNVVDGRAVRWDSPTSSPIILPLPSASYPVTRAVAYAINNSNVIAGYVTESLSKNRTRSEAVMWSGNSVSMLPMPAGATSVVASNINDAGVISGIADASRPVRWTPNNAGGYNVEVANIDTSPANLATAIDACGRVAGGSNIGAWVWEPGGTPVFLAGLGGLNQLGVIRDISESGIAVGTSRKSNTHKTGLVQPATVWTGLPACNP